MDEQKTSIITSTFRKCIEMKGYIVSDKILCELDDNLRAIFARCCVNETIDINIVAHDAGEEKLKFASILELLAYLEESEFLLAELQVDYEVKESLRVEVFFSKDGRIDILIFGPSGEVPFIVDGLVRNLEKARKKYNWLESKIALSKRPGRLPSMLIPTVAFFLIVNVLYYFYALRVGVDIDEALIYSDNGYFNEVAGSLGEVPIEQKIDILLKGQLRGFKNVSDVIGRTKLFIKVASALLFILFLFKYCSNRYSKLYPFSFFNIGASKELLKNIESKRDLWAWSVFVGLIVNVMAGFVVAFIL